jgi:hypothetical protein
VQAVIDFPSLHGGHRAPGDLFGPPSRVELDPSNDATIRLRIDSVRQDKPVEYGLLGIEFESASLPLELGLPAKHRAWVALPRGYDNIHTARRIWPTVYFIPDHGSARDAATTIARLLRQPEMKLIMPQAIWVVLDPDGPTGHHFFTDSPTNGSRSRALVEEFIPWLEIRFRAIPDAKARVLYGIGAGGRAALGLFADHPTVFSWVAAISPEALSFGSIGTVNLYTERNAFRTANGTPRIAVRSPLGPNRDRIHAEVEGEVDIARVISPDGFSGTRWDAMRSAFGVTMQPKRAPPWPFDPESGAIDREVVSGWKRHDLVLRALENPELASRLQDHSYIIVGERDQWYRQRGVFSLEAVLATQQRSDDSETPATGLIKILPGATAEEVAAVAPLRIFDAMIDHLQENDLHD